MKIEYCPTKEMVADFFTKPLQGSQFIKLRDQIMNVNPLRQDYTSEDCRSVLNINMTDNGQTEGIATDSDWTVVESKRTKHAKRLASCVIGSLNRDAHGNGEAKGKRVRFVELD